MNLPSRFIQRGNQVFDQRGALVGTIDRRGELHLEVLAGWPFDPPTGPCPRDEDGNSISLAENTRRIWAELNQSPELTDENLPSSHL